MSPSISSFFCFATSARMRSRTVVSSSTATASHAPGSGVCPACSGHCVFGPPTPQEYEHIAAGAYATPTRICWRGRGTASEGGAARDWFERSAGHFTPDVFLLLPDSGMVLRSNTVGFCVVLIRRSRVDHWSLFIMCRAFPDNFTSSWCRGQAIGDDDDDELVYPRHRAIS